jgi:hypothetical protein
MINDQRPVHRIKGTLLWVVTIAAWLVMLALVLNSVLGTSKEAKKIRNLDKMVEVEKRRGIKVNFKLSWQVASSNSSLIAVERKADAARPGLSLDQGPPLLR